MKLLSSRGFWSAGAALLAVLFLVSCDKSDLTYTFTENRCSTGSQSFATREAYCEGLQSASRNNGALCAITLRQSAFRSNCTGTYQDLP